MGSCKAAWFVALQTHWFMVHKYQPPNCKKIRVELRKILRIGSELAGHTCLLFFVKVCACMPVSFRVALIFKMSTWRISLFLYLRIFSISARKSKCSI